MISTLVPERSIDVRPLLIKQLAPTDSRFDGKETDARLAHMKKEKTLEEALDEGRRKLVLSMKQGYAARGSRASWRRCYVPCGGARGSRGCAPADSPSETS